ncbi:uncharacterized protein IL334_007169 [Kwoniella shivajii]|uniref:F-box domain-containing protein n=1 Tax=Kwoniella shivajii TaxID=564305 RepID=A0ABZ1DA24_9TREE|nr:hypothetical protein IL334_007169 [Kwoniella shivajii]
MPKSLLDLNDEILWLIGQYVDGDLAIPMPSFGPYWTTYPDLIDPKTSRDLIFFRSTCRRLRHACRLQGIHMVIDEIEVEGRAGPEENLCSDGIQKCVRRARISPLCRRRSLRGHSPETTFASKLQPLSYLEELSVQHGTETSSKLATQVFETLPEPLDFLPNLKSLSVDFDCNDCSGHLPLLLITSAPKLQHLKMYLDPPVDVPDWDPLQAFSAILKAWTDHNLKPYMPLTTLYLKYPWSARGIIWRSWGKVIREAFKLLPELEDFQVASFNKKGKELTFGTYLICSKEEQGNAELVQWKFEVMNLEDGDWRNSWTLEEMINYLKPSSKLKIFDPIIVIQPGESRPCNLSPSSNHITRKSIYHDQNSYESSRFEDLLSKYEHLLRSQMKAAAEALIELVPSLQEGAFWERGTEVSYDDWYRWKWTKSIGDDGTPEAEVTKTPLTLKTAGKSQ